MKLFRKGKHRRPPNKARRRRIAKIGAGVLAAATAAVLLSLPLGAIADVDENKIKSETVYAVLEDNGAYSGATVVNCFATSGEIVDYGAYTSVANLMGTAAPLVSADSVTWNGEATNGHNSFYYQGQTDKALPFSIAIGYTLDGQETSPKQIAGKSGELEISFDITNNATTGVRDELADRDIYIPFAVQVSMTLDTEVFTIVKLPENATTLQAGSNITVAYSSFPLPDDSFAVTLRGQHIEMDPINITALPKAPPGLDSYGDFVDTDEMSDGTDEMIDGTADMMEGVDELLDGLYEMKDAAKDMKSGLRDLSGGADDLSDGVDELYEGARSLAGKAGDFEDGFALFVSSFAEFDAGMEALNTGTADMAASMADLNDSAALLDAGVAALDDGVNGVALSNAQLEALAAGVAAKFPDADTAALAAGVAAQQTALDALTAASADLGLLSAGVSQGVGAFYTELSTTFADNMALMRASSAALYASSAELLAGAEGLSGGCRSLKSGISDLADGAGDLADGADKAADGVPELIDGIDDMIEGVEGLKEGIAELQTDGLVEMKDSLNGLDGYLKKLADEAEKYGSFMDERNAAHSSVQFVLKTNGIAIPEAAPQRTPQPEEESGFLEKIGDLF